MAEHNAVIPSGTILHYVNKYIYKEVQIGYGKDYARRHKIKKLCLLQDVSFYLPDNTHVTFDKTKTVHVVITPSTDLAAFDILKHIPSRPILLLPVGTHISQNNGLDIQLNSDLEVLLTSDTPIKLNKGNKLIKQNTVDGFTRYNHPSINEVVKPLESNLFVRISHYTPVIFQNNTNISSGYIDYID